MHEGHSPRRGHALPGGIFEDFLKACYSVTVGRGHARHTSHELADKTALSVKV